MKLNLILKIANVNINNATIKMNNYQGINNEISQNKNSLANNHSEVSNCLNLDIGNNQNITISKSLIDLHMSGKFRIFA